MPNKELSAFIKALAGFLISLQENPAPARAPRATKPARAPRAVRVPRAAPLPAPQGRALVEAILTSKTPLGISEIVARTGIDKKDAARDIRRLVKDGTLKMIGAKRGAKYQAA